MSFIDQVDKAVAKMPTGVHAISEGDRVRVIDTPHVWGAPMTEKGVADGAAKAVAALADTVYQVIANATIKVDIVSLNPADGVFLKAIKAGLLKVATVKSRVTVRFLFGWVPTRDTVTAFTKDLAEFCRANKIDMRKMNLLVGQYYSYKPAWWNHAKIVAADGMTAVVGGHNLWDTAYGQYPPVHDISIQVVGNAAAHAHGFADFLWEKGGKNLVACRIDGRYQAKVLEPGVDRDKITMLELDEEFADKPPVDWAAVAKDWPPARMLALGRAGGLNNSAYNASDVAKRLVITSAKKTLKICQQDLLFRGAASESEHLVCGWIADAVLANADLRVFIVVSPLDGSGGGDQYSWGSGAVGTYKLLKKMVAAKANHVGKATAAMDRVSVAPFCFTKVDFKSEGVDYNWPGVSKDRRAGRFGTTVPTPSLSKYVPAPGNHAKVYIADDTAYYVGSDNLYPHNLAEFGYLVEGEAVEEFVATYWDRVWGFSESHRITEESISPRSEEDESAIGVELTMMVSERKGKSKEKNEFAEVFFGDDEDL